MERHLSEVSRPSGDIIGWSPARPCSGPSRAYLTRHLPPASFLSSSTACASADLPAFFHAGAAHGVSRVRPSSIRRGWRRKIAGPDRPRAQWQRSRSSTAMPGHRRWSVDRSRTSDWNRSRRRVSGPHTSRFKAFEAPGRPEPSGGGSGEKRRRSATAHPENPHQTQHRSAHPGEPTATPATEAATAADRRTPPGHSAMPDRPEAIGPSQRFDRSRAARSGPLPGSNGGKSALPTRNQRIDGLPRTGPSTPPGLRGNDRSRHRPAGLHSQASEQEQKRPSATSSDCE